MSAEVVREFWVGAGGRKPRETKEIALDMVGLPGHSLVAVLGRRPRASTASAWRCHA